MSVHTTKLLIIKMLCTKQLSNLIIAQFKNKRATIGGVSKRSLGERSTVSRKDVIGGSALPLHLCCGHE